MKRVEWDTLMFFYGVILCVGALGALGYLAVLSQISYAALGPTVANTLVGVASALVDNIPIMFAVLSIGPEMSDGQWLLVTLTAGVGGSLLSIGSAAGVALSRQPEKSQCNNRYAEYTLHRRIGQNADAIAKAVDDEDDDREPPSPPAPQK